MKVFELLSSVLEELWNEIEGTEAEKIAAVNAAIAEVRGGYKNLISASAPKPPDYSQAVHRFAYIYMYTTCHANLMVHAFAISSELRNLLEQEHLTMACIGGGPGSELLGVLKVREDWSKLVAVSCQLFDRAHQWGEAWIDVGQKLGTTITTSYQLLDATDEDTWKTKTKYLKADLFTFVFFMSEVYRDRDAADSYFADIFARAKVGALFVFIDNNHSEFSGWFDKHASDAGLEVLESYEGHLQMPTDEEKKDLGKFFGIFNCTPKLGSDVAIRVARKTK